jgi:hypothetical protein
MRTETRSITIDAPSAAVLDLVGDARSLPRWAPDFARSVRADGEHWIINDAARIDMVRGADTVDIVAADDRRRGAFSRVLPNGDSSEFLFTLFFPDGTGEDAVAAQMAVVEDELRTVRDLCQAK